MKFQSNKFTPYALLMAGVVLVLLSFQTFFTVSHVKTPTTTSASRTNTHSVNDNSPVKACFVVLVRNRELGGIISTIQQVEKTFNKKFQYPYVFLNDDEFTEEFIARTSDLTTAQTKYGKVDDQMWGYPKYINQTLAAECRKDLAAMNIPYAESESYRHMCRYNFFIESFCHSVSLTCFIF